MTRCGDRGRRGKPDDAARRTPHDAPVGRITDRGTEFAMPFGAAVERVASWVVADVPAGRVSLAAGRLRLGPGTEVTLGRAPGQVLLLVEAGTLGLAVEQRTGAVLQPGVVEHATDGTPPGDLVPRAAGPTSGRENELVDAGGVVVLPPTGTAGLSAAEAAAVSCLVFALLPERE